MTSCLTLSPAICLHLSEFPDNHEILFPYHNVIYQNTALDGCSTLTYHWFLFSSILPFTHFVLSLCLYHLLPAVSRTTRTATSCGVRREGARVRAGCLRMCLCLKCPVRPQQEPLLERTVGPRPALLVPHPHRLEDHPPPQTQPMSCQVTAATHHLTTSNLGD